VSIDISSLFCTLTRNASHAVIPMKLSTPIAPAEVEALLHNLSDKSLSIKHPSISEVSGPDEHLLRVYTVALTNAELSWPEPVLLRKRLLILKCGLGAEV
jgi:hypothetical protein